MTLRIDKNKILYIISQNELYAGENTNEMIQLYIHPSLCNEDLSKCEINLHYKNNAIQDNYDFLFVSNEKKDSFYITENIINPKMISTSGLLELWVNIKTPVTNIKSSPIKIQIKPTRKQKINRNISAESDDQEDRLIALENRCKTYMQMAKKESEKAKKCVQIMIDLIKEQGGIR